jgi:hypothetical protein
LSGLRFHEPLLLQSFRAKSRNPVAESSIVSRAPSTPLRFARDDMGDHCKALQRESCRSASSPIGLFVK